MRYVWWLEHLGAVVAPVADGGVGGCHLHPGRVVGMQEGLGAAADLHSRESPTSGRSLWGAGSAPAGHEWWLCGIEDLCQGAARGKGHAGPFSGCY
jgi:hypothetical protein